MVMSLVPVLSEYLRTGTCREPDSSNYYFGLIAIVVESF